MQIVKSMDDRYRASPQYRTLPKARYFEVLSGLNAENRSDHKVAMVNEVDMTECERVRAAFAARGDQKPTYTAFITKAIASALGLHPHANRITIELPFRKRIVQLNQVHITVAVERDAPGIEQAVFAGTIYDADQKDLATLTAELHALATSTEDSMPRWRVFKTIVERLPTTLAHWILSMPRLTAGLWIEHRGGSVMISSPAKYGVDMILGAWPWPLGFSFGFVRPRAVVVGDRVEVRPTMFVTMSFDRRIIGGAPATRFFSTVCQQLASASDQVVRPAPADVT
jgi:pyruvate/2-oxoglutarate dehydrogenase complex dihydrolipoamide acyltransferase (E2) component